MEGKPIIYTYGNISIDVKDLLCILQPYHINCVVDCRPQAYTRSIQNTPADKLQEVLQKHNITYLPCVQYFGVFPSEVRNSKGTILYSKVIKASNFLKGIKLIEQEVQMRHIICIIDNQKEIAQSRRYTFIGKYLHEKYTVCHLIPAGGYLTQEQVEQKQEEYKNYRRQKNRTSQKIGRTGEELAALYLTNNGYQILDHNWNLHRGCELDLVAMKDNTLHFIEVKTRTSDLYGEPQVAINRQKMLHICHAIQQYRYRRGFFGRNSQIDSIAIIYRADNDYDLKHFLDIHPNGSACADVITFQQRPNSPR